MRGWRDRTSNLLKKIGGRIMKHKKIISMLLFSVSGALLVCFSAKTIADYITYAHTVNGAPFMLWIAVNAFCFITPATVAASAGLYIRQLTRVLFIVTAVLAGLTALMVIILMLLHHALADSILYGIPFALSTLISGIFTAVSRCQKHKA